MRTRTVLTSLIMMTLLLDCRTASARPLYLKVFKEVYSKFEKTGKCSICHPVKSKKNRNHYGEALGEALSGKNVKDKDEIRKALKKIEKKECGGNVWKDRLDEGKAPCTHGGSSGSHQYSTSLIERLLSYRSTSTNLNSVLRTKH